MLYLELVEALEEISGDLKPFCVNSKIINDVKRMSKNEKKNEKPMKISTNYSLFKIKMNLGIN
jgi:hypothetical protein